jgi:hypothetical protein
MVGAPAARGLAQSASLTLFSPSHPHPNPPLEGEGEFVHAIALPCAKPTRRGVTGGNPRELNAVGLLVGGQRLSNLAAWLGCIAGTELLLQVALVIGEVMNDLVQIIQAVRDEVARRIE